MVTYSDGTIYIKKLSISLIQYHTTAKISFKEK